MMGIPAGTIERFRTHWASRFVDTITVTRQTGRGTYNPTTMQYGADTTTSVYTGGALIRPSKYEEVVTGERQATGAFRDIMIPYSASQFQPDDIVTVTATKWDTVLDGQTGRVVEVESDTYLTRRKLTVRFDLGSGYGDTG